MKMKPPGLPRHVAIIMDGNGRWAKARCLPRVAGHSAGVNSARTVVQAAQNAGVEVLTLFAFSSENWQRPRKEVNFLLELFDTALTREAQKLHENNIRLKIIGDKSKFDQTLIHCMSRVEKLTEHNTGLTLIIAANYGGRWDITQAAKQLAEKVKNNILSISEITDATLEAHLSLAGIPHPDLLIRTSGERRVSNFLMWELAYAELYFTPTFWPDFSDKEFNEALTWYANRVRRFGQIDEQLKEAALC